MQWPSFLLSTAKHLLYVDNSSVKTVHTGLGIYYGITWDGSLVYVAHRNSKFGSPTPEISIFNQRFDCVGTISGDFNDVHQIVYVKELDSLFVTATGYNSIVGVKGDSQQLYNWTEHSTDVNHINSIWFDGSHFWCTYHNFVAKGHAPTSRVVQVNKELTQEVFGINVGRDVHNVFVDNRRILIGDSSTESLGVYDLDKKEYGLVKLGDWVRGIASTKDYLLVGTSLFAERRNRLHGHCAVHLLDRKTLRVLDRRIFDDVGAVMEIRVTSEPDEAHNGIIFPGNKE